MKKTISKNRHLPQISQNLAVSINRIHQYAHQIKGRMAEWLSRWTRNLASGGEVVSSNPERIFFFLKKNAKSYKIARNNCLNS